MQVEDLLTTPVIIMVLAIATGFLMYAWSRSVAPPFIRSVNKTMPYVGGEAIEAQAYQPGYQFCSIVLYRRTCCSTGYCNSTSGCTTLGYTRLPWLYCYCCYGPQVGTMSSRTCAEKCLGMRCSGVQNNLSRQDYHTVVPINDLIYHDEGDSTRWQSR
jgi:hypothetical protein